MKSPNKMNGKSVTVGLLGLSLLAVLDKFGDAATGGDIWDVLEQQSGKRVHSGTIYTTLKRMREKGLVMESVTQQGRPTRTYKISELGSEVLNDYKAIFSNNEHRSDNLGGALTG